MNIILYRTFVIVMLVGFAGASCGATDWKGRIIGAALFAVNLLIFWK